MCECQPRQGPLLNSYEWLLCHHMSVLLLACICMLVPFRLPPIQNIAEMPQLEDATKKQHQHALALVVFKQHPLVLLFNLLCGWFLLLLYVLDCICEVYVAECKLAHVLTHAERTLSGGSVTGQMEAMLEDTFDEVKKALAIFVHSM